MSTRTCISIVPRELRETLSHTNKPSDSSTATSHQNRYLRLPHPRTGKPSLYLSTLAQGHGTTEAAVNEGGVWEVQAVNPEKKRSWFYHDQVLGDGSLLLTTPIDPLFLVLPLLLSLVLSNSSSSAVTLANALSLEKTGKRTDRFLPLDDLLESLSRVERCRLAAPFSTQHQPKAGTKHTIDQDEDIHQYEEPTNEDEWMGSEDVERLCSMTRVRNRVVEMCQAQDISGQTFYRPSIGSSLSLLKTKLTRLADPSTFASVPSLRRGLITLGLGPLIDSQEALIKNESGDPVKPTEMSASDEKVLELARMRVVADVVGEYLEDSVRVALMAEYDFTPLDSYLESQDAISFAATHHVGQGRTDSEAMMDLLEGKENAGPTTKSGLKRKGSQVKGSRAAESLKKVNTSKMAKLTTFFKKKE